MKRDIPGVGSYVILNRVTLGRFRHLDVKWTVLEDEGWATEALIREFYCDNRGEDGAGEVRMVEEVVYDEDAGVYTVIVEVMDEGT
jgi:hypothetical protein